MPGSSTSDCRGLLEQWHASRRHSSGTWLSTVNMTESCKQLEAKIDAQNPKNLKTHESMTEEFLVGLVPPVLPALRQTKIKRKVPLVASFPLDGRCN